MSSGGSNACSSKAAACLDVALWIVMAVYTLKMPYTKVEESFNMQAMHDLQVLGGDVGMYDHQLFPGVVPRTFIGAAAVSSLSSLVEVIVRYCGLPRFWLQISSRLILGSLVVVALVALHRVAARKWGNNGANLSRLLALSQFHLLFYSSRPLPNTFALLFVTAAAACWAAAPALSAAGSTPNKKSPAQHSGAPSLFGIQWSRYAWELHGWSWRIAQTCALLTASTVWFRCDMLVFLAPALLCILWQHKVGFVPLLVFGVVFGAATLALTVGVDSVFWGRWLWPEGEVFFFNAIKGGSVAWGVSSWHWYATSALPRGLLLAFPLAIVFLVQRAAQRCTAQPKHCDTLDELAGMVCSVFVFVALYSKLPHKELRFLLPAFPLFNLGAGYALAPMTNNEHASSEKAQQPQPSRRSSLGAGLAWLCVAAVLIANTAATWLVFVPASSINYPGGEALQQLHAAHDGAVRRGELPQRFGEEAYKPMCNAEHSSAPVGCGDFAYEQEHVAAMRVRRSTTLRVLAWLPSSLWPPGLGQAEHETEAPHYPLIPLTERVAPQLQQWGVSPIRVHICTRAAMTGVSRFGQRGAPWLYSKNESAQLEQLEPEHWADAFEYVIAEPGDARAVSEHFDALFHVAGLDAGRSLGAELRRIAQQGDSLAAMLQNAVNVWAGMQSEQLVVLRSWRLRPAGGLPKPRSSSQGQIEADGTVK